MSTTVNLNGTEYTLPTNNDIDWGTQLIAYLRALAGVVAPGVITFGVEATPADTSTNYLRPGCGFACDSTEVKLAMPCAGHISNLQLRESSGSGPQGGTVAVTVRKNGSDTLLTATLAASGTSASDTLPAHGFDVAAGDTLSMKVVGGSGISSGAVGLTASVQLTAT